MKILRSIVVVAFMAVGCAAGSSSSLADDRVSLERTTKAIRDAFARGDVPAIVALHHPDVFKWFGGDNYVKGRAALEKGLTDMFRTTKLEFTENQVESTLFNGETAVETSIFTIKGIPENGGEPTFSRGRAMVVYIRSNESPTGWVSVREMAQAAPED